MKPRYKMAIGMFMLVVVAGVVSAGIFYLQGSQTAVYAQMAVVPLLIVVGYLWVNRTVQSTGASRSEFERRKARQLAEQFSDVWQLAQEIESEYDAGMTKSDWEHLEQRATDLESNGIAFDTDTGSFDISNRNLGSLEDINRLQSELENIDKWLIDQFTQNVRNRITEINSTLKRLRSLVTDPETIDPTEVSSGSPEVDSAENMWRETGQWLDDCHHSADQVVEDACESLQDAVMSTPDDVDPQVETLLSEAREASSLRRYDVAVENVLDARDIVERDAATQFDDQQTDLKTLLVTAGNKEFGSALHPSYQETIEDYQQTLDSIDEAIDIAELRDLREDSRETCTEIVKNLESQLDEAINTLDDADIPEGWFAQPEAVNEEYVRRLQSAQDLNSFHEEFDRAVDQLLSTLDTVKPKATVVTGFDRIEDQIDKTLRQEGIVNGESLPVSELEQQFLGLYYRKNMDTVSYEPDVPQLISKQEGENYDLHVTAAFPSGGNEREVSIEVDGAQSRLEVCQTPLVAETTFEDLPYGEYTVRIESREESYAPEERQVMLDTEVNVEIELKELSLREQLCDGVDVDVDQILTNLSARFKTKFESEGYISTDMSFPVDKEYIPCLVVIWAQRENYEATQHDGKVVVYKREQLRKEIENVIRYNLEEGESKTFAELRNNFLSAPISDMTVEALVSDSSEQNVVTVSDSSLTKMEEQ